MRGVTVKNLAFVLVGDSVKLEETQDRVSEADVLVISGFWRNELLEEAKKLTYIQSIGAGYDQFPLDVLEKRGILLANASGVNADAVSQHAMALVLAFIRHLPSGRDNQRQHLSRDMISALNDRQDDLCVDEHFSVHRRTATSRQSS